MEWKQLSEGGKGLGVAILVMFFCLACGSARPPAQSMANADMAIKLAQQSEASVYAPLELQLAQEKYARAQQAVEKEEMTQARRLAEEAQVDARLAEEKAQTMKTKQLTQQLRESIATLQREIEYNQSR